MVPRYAWNLYRIRGKSLFCGGFAVGKVTRYKHRRRLCAQAKSLNDIHVNTYRIVVRTNIAAKNPAIARASSHASRRGNPLSCRGLFASSIRAKGDSNRPCRSLLREIAVISGFFRANLWNWIAVSRIRSRSPYRSLAYRACLSSTDKSALSIKAKGTCYGCTLTRFPAPGNFLRRVTLWRKKEEYRLAWSRFVLEMARYSDILVPCRKVNSMKKKMREREVGIYLSI